MLTFSCDQCSLVKLVPNTKRREKTNYFSETQCRRIGGLRWHKLEQLERLRSEDTPRRPMVTHTMDPYQIPCHNKTTSKLQI